MPSRTIALARAICLGCGLLTLTMCSKAPTGADPSPEGIWHGTMADDRFGPGTFNLVLEAQHRSFSYAGDWTAAFVSGRRVEGLLTASEKSTITDLSVTLECSDGGTALLHAHVDGARLTGSYATTDCASLSQGSVDLTRN